ncbi:hypothetical protein WP12_12665 [Sphingomonas sp. SRS2]|nr:hypothetical protein WP12_12665 [Sphingomonas sp. SRS2]
MPRAILATAMVLTLAACGAKSLEPRSPKALPNDWRTIATQADRDRIARWRQAWIAGLEKATAAGNGSHIAAQGALLKPDLTLDDPLLPAGDYRCRTFKLGAQTKGLLDYVAYPPFTCRVTTADGRLRLAKIDGSQRPVGDIFPDEGRRMIFLGAMTLGDEARPRPYGRDAERDMAGIVERVAPDRWRIAFPYPRWESTIDILELVPKG